MRWPRYPGLRSSCPFGTEEQGADCARRTRTWACDRSRRNHLRDPAQTREHRGAGRGQHARVRPTHLPTGCGMPSVINDYAHIPSAAAANVPVSVPLFPGPRRLARSSLVRLVHSLPFSGLRRRTLSPFHLSAPAIPPACPGVVQVLCYTTQPLELRPGPGRPGVPVTTTTIAAGRPGPEGGRKKRMKNMSRGVPGCSEERKRPPGKPGAFGGVTHLCHGMHRPRCGYPSTSTKREAEKRIHRRGRCEPDIHRASLATAR
jgi:hypothetical protein